MILRKIPLALRFPAFSFTFKVKNFSTSNIRLNEYERFVTNKAFINGKFCSPSTNNYFEVYNPSNNLIVGTAAECNAEDAHKAVDSAKDAFATWSETTAKERAHYIQRLYELQIKNSEALAKLITAEMGKPIKEARGEIAYGASFFKWFAEEATRICGEILQSPWKDKQISYYKEPAGVVGIITPWNFPNAMITRKLGAVLAAGCTAVIKPAEDTPYSALAIAALAEEAKFPPGVINVVPTSRKNTPEIGNFLCDTPIISVLSFTGSTDVGKYLIQRSASTVKRVCLELGGDAPFIVFDSANLESAVSGCMASKFRNAGQTCVCANRIFVQESIYDKFVELLASRMSSELLFGDGVDENTTMGPLINEQAVAKVKSHVEDAVNKGAKVVKGGKLLNQSQNCLFFEPTLLTNVDSQMLVAKEETFGPVAAIFKFKTEDEVVQIANSSRRGLAGYFYSQDYSQIARVSRRLQVGMVGVNEGVISTCEAPFGGVKESGLGREGGHFGVDEFLNVKYVCLGGLK